MLDQLVALDQALGRRPGPLPGSPQPGATAPTPSPWRPHAGNTRSPLAGRV